MPSSPGLKFPQIPGCSLDAFIGEGATGQVFRSTIEGREVAIKVLKRLGVNRNLLGFALTRLSQLPAHPHLAELVNFSMEGKPLFIATHLYAREREDGSGLEGATLEPYCGNLSPGLAWAMIRQICQGLAFLHTHGILHCGLNPRNVLVADAEAPVVKLTDFCQGWLAEISHIDFSPSFLCAPPEQLRAPQQMFEGQAQRWDVYAFAVTAYRLLYGRFPRGQGWMESVHQGKAAFHPLAYADVLEAEPEVAWPEAADEHDQKRLDVLQRCLSLDPRRRFSDLRQVDLAFQEIDREEKLANERREAEERERALSEKLRVSRKKMQRFRLAALGLLVALLLSLVMNVTSESRLRQSREAMGQLEKTSGQEIAEAERERLLALDEATRFKSNLTYAQSTADTFLEFLLNAKNPDSPEYQSIDGYLGSARQHYERVLRATEDEEGLVLERLRAQLGSARIEMQLGEPAKAVPLLEALVEEIEALPEAIQQSTAMQETLGSALLEIGRFHAVEGTRAVALESFEKSVKVLNRQLSLAPKNLDLKRKSGKALFFYAEQLARMGDLKMALKRQQGAMQVLEELAQSADAREEDEYYLALCQFEVGLISYWENKGIEAFQAFQLASRGYSRLMDQKPQIPEYRFQLARCLYYLGDLSFQEKGDEEDAALARRSMRELLRLLLEKDEANRDYQFYLALVLADLAEMARDAGERASAQEDMGQALAILNELHKAVPENGDYTFRLAIMKAAQGDFLLDSDEKASAVKALDEAGALLQKVEAGERKPSVPDHVYRFRSASVAGMRGHALEASGQRAEATQSFSRSREILRALAQERPEDSRIQNALEAAENRASGA